MATTLETSHTVAAVLSVFHNAVDLMKQLTKRSKKKKSEQALRLKWLLETLESGELQISKKYSQYLEELGDRFKVGDNVARDRLQHVAIIMQAELLRCLQLAIDYDNAELDVNKLHEDASFFRRDVIAAFDELRDRLLKQAPAQPPPMFSQMVPAAQRPSISSPTTPNTPGSEAFPPGVTVPDSHEDESHHRMSRLFSIRSRPHKRSSSSSATIQNMVVAPNLSWLGPVQAEPQRYELAGEDVPRQENPPSPYSDVKPHIPDPDTEFLHPAMIKHSSINRHASTSTHSSDHSNYTRNSAFSDEKIPILEENEEATFNTTDLANALPPAIPPAPLNIRTRQTQNRISSASTGSHFSATLMSPPGTATSNSPLPSPSPTGLSPDYSPHSYWFPQHPTSDPSSTLPIPPIQARNRSNTASSSGTTSSNPHPQNHYNRTSIVNAHTTHSPSIVSAFSSSGSSGTTTTGVSLVGRPEKKNNYWGFCKGSWTIREDWRKGLQQQVVQAGMFNQSSVWQCRHCCFQGGIYGAKKPYTVNPNVLRDGDTGIRYKWLFLAKCHVKVKIVARPGEGGFGCLFCSLENVQTGVYASEGLLFRHIMDDHAPGMTDAQATRAKCVVGRRAEVGEDFDINIP